MHFLHWIEAIGSLNTSFLTILKVEMIGGRGILPDKLADGAKHLRFLKVLYYAPTTGVYSSPERLMRDEQLVEGLAKIKGLQELGIGVCGGASDTLPDCLRELMGIRVVGIAGNFWGSEVIRVT